MACSTCNSERILHLSAKHNDMLSIQVPHLEQEHVGYAPYINGRRGEKFLGGDYTRISFCLDCGQIQNFRPITDEELVEELG